jgi:hypothetical protein
MRPNDVVAGTHWSDLRTLAGISFQVREYVKVEPFISFFLPEYIKKKEKDSSPKILAKDR